MRPCKMLTALMLLAAASVNARADVKLPAIFGDNMVLQMEREVPFWGTADPGERIRVEYGDDDVAARLAEPVVADKNGRWKLSLRFSRVKPGEPFSIGFYGKNTVRFKNVLLGDVWLCSGQSNMEWPVRRAASPKEEIAGANYPKIRLFKVRKVVAGRPLDDTQGEWVECSPETIADFTAVGYFFGRALHEKLDRPIGLIQSAWGGTPAEAWTSRKTLESDPELRPIVERWDRIVSEAKAKKAANNKERRRYGPNHPHRVSGLYNGMIAPIAPIALKGAIWYQGESNAGRAYQYRRLFPAMIADWRRTWGQGDFPFLFVQLANFMARSDQPQESAWAELREAQALTLKKVPKTGMAVIIDIGEARDIHPKNKQDVGRRLALAARAIACGERDLVYSGPVFESMEINGDEIRLKFEHVGGGLAARGGTLKGFAVAGKDRKFHWAEARIEGKDTVVVSSKAVENPVAVRYAWADNPEATLYNQEGLPASPFRTDDWPGVTAGKR